MKIILCIYLKQIYYFQGEYSKRSSGVVYDTVFAGVPVVGRRCSALLFVEKEHIGFLYDSLDDFDISEIMNRKLYEDYLKAIETYKIKHKTYIAQLAQFLKIKE